MLTGTFDSILYAHLEQIFLDLSRLHVHNEADKHLQAWNTEPLTSTCRSFRYYGAASARFHSRTQEFDWSRATASYSLDFPNSRWNCTHRGK